MKTRNTVLTNFIVTFTTMCSVAAAGFACLYILIDNNAPVLYEYLTVAATIVSSFVFGFVTCFCLHYIQEEEEELD
jgi:hypothetical protein